MKLDVTSDEISILLSALEESADGWWEDEETQETAEQAYALHHKIYKQSI